MSKIPPWWLLAAATFAAWAPADVAAFRQTKTCLFPDERDPSAPTAVPDCAPGETSWPVAWRQPALTYQISRAGTADLPGPGGQISEALVASLRASFDTWNAAPCSAWVFEYGGLTDLTRDQPQDRINVVAFIDEGWPETSGAIALTMTTMTSRGEIVDADMILNSQQHTFTDTDDARRAITDVRNTVTHEAGHMLGLDHTPVVQATMHFEAPPGELQKRDLHPDDVNGACTIYPAGVPARIYEDEIEQGCCATSPARPRGVPALALLALAALARRRAPHPRG